MRLSPIELDRNQRRKAPAFGIRTSLSPTGRNLSHDIGFRRDLNEHIDERFRNVTTGSDQQHSPL
jgi:hypothetical protein